MKVCFVNRQLAFGSAIRSWKHVERLRAHEISHVINLRRSTNKKIQQFPNLWLAFRDNAKPRPRWFYSRALRFYRRAMEQPRAKVYVMCHHGICRSASLTYFLLRASGSSSRKAKARVFKARPCARIARAYQESGEDFLRGR